MCAAPNAWKRLVNDLDLIVTTPEGTEVLFYLFLFFYFIVFPCEFFFWWVGFCVFKWCDVCVCVRVVRLRELSF